MANLIPKSHIILRQHKPPLPWQRPTSSEISDASIRRTIGRFTSSVVAIPPLHPRFRFHSLPLRNCPLLHPLHLLPLRRLPLLCFFSSMSASVINSSDTPDSTNKTVRVMIKGRVQGVFYRDWTVENAKELGLKGWVRNRRDGSVEALFSGAPQKVDEMEQRCRRGPPHAMVTGLQVFPCTDDPGASFERKQTA